ncbi:MAG: aminodeoxychorismate/anthranilate synthase component II [Muribaculaceae bacterium]|nr:aminodeoxychorismate/anthranilate synthase component II [Muribaculaceae bacterium]
MTRILIVDNHDSFVYNIAGLLRQCRSESGLRLSWTVVRCDEVSDSHLDSCDAVILSPGPGLPEEASGLMDIIRRCVGHKPLLGICLGCQAIAMHYGGTLRSLPSPRHGHVSNLRVEDISDPLMRAFAAPSSPRVGRYHSWVVSEADFPASLLVTARDEEGNIMALRHRCHAVYGVQFHPESIMTESGAAMMTAFLKSC